MPSTSNMFLARRLPTPQMPYWWVRWSGTASTASRLDLPPSFSAASIICFRQPGLFSTSSSGSTTANGSSPTMSRAHQTACPRPSGACWRGKLVSPPAGQGSAGVLSSLVFSPALGERAVELEGDVEVVLDRALVAPRDENEMLDPGLLRLVDDVLHDRAVD